MIRKNIAIKIFLSVLAAFIFIFLFQIIMMTTFVVSMYNKKFIDNAESVFHDAAVDFASKKNGEGFRDDEIREILTSYTVDNSSPIVALDENGNLLDTGILSGYNILHVKNLRGKSMYLLADYLVNYFDSPIDKIKPNIMYIINAVPIGDSGFYKLVSITEEDKLNPHTVYTDYEFLFDNPNSINRLSQFVYYVEILSPAQTKNLTHRNKLLFELISPKILSGEDPNKIVDEINGMEISDNFGNTYIVFGFKVFVEGTVNYFVSLKYFENSNLVIEYMSNYYIWLYVFFMAISVMLIYFYSKQLSSPLIHLSRVAQRLSNLDFSERAMHSSPDQLGKLSESLNTLSDNLQKALDDSNQTNKKLQEKLREESENARRTRILMEDLAHEFKTPLGVISGFTELLEYDIEKENSNYYFEIINEEINKLTDMVNDTIDMSKIESGYSPFDLEPLNINALMHEILLRFIPEFEKENFTIECDVKNHMVMAHKKSLIKVIDNLISNSYKHSKTDKFVHIYSRKTDIKTITLYFANAGNLNSEEIERIWNKYTTTGENLPFVMKGDGIGLTIVSRMLNLHGSDFGAFSENNRVTFYFTLQLGEENL